MSESLSMRIRVPMSVSFDSGCTDGAIIPELPWVGFNVWTRRRPQNKGRHAHPDAWEIHYQVRGRIEQWIGDRTHTVRANHLFVMPPGAVHSGMDVVRHRCEMCWFAIRLPPMVSWPGLSAGEVDDVVTGMRAIALVPFQAEAGVLPALADLLEECREGGRGSVPITRALVHRLTFGVLRSWAIHRRTQSVPAALSPEITAAIGLLRERIAAPVRVASLARAVGLGRSVLTERFVAETGLGPGEYLTHLRIERAQQLLTTSSIRETAFSLGYANAQHFGTVFKRLLGVTPGVWRQRTAIDGE